MVAIVASAINIDHVRRNHQGRDAFMEYQSERYDRYVAEPNFQQPISQSLLLCGAFLLIYEIIAFNTMKIISFMSESNSKKGEI